VNRERRLGHASAAFTIHCLTPSDPKAEPPPPFNVKSRRDFLGEHSMERTWREKIEGTSEQILAQIKRLIDEGNVRRVVVKQQGRVVAEFPLTVGVVGTMIAPVAAAIGALTAILTDCSIEVEKTVSEAPSTNTTTSTPGPPEDVRTAV
jgi:Domain of unknown function (DUF4342)